MKDLEENDENSFKPLMSHQVFGETEKVFGYIKPVVKLYYCSSTLETYISFRFEEKIDPEEFEGVEGDKVVRDLVKNAIRQPYTENIDKFSIKIQEQAKFRPLGEHMYTYRRTCQFTDQVSTFEVYKTNVNTPGFLEYHKKMQSFILWFIDAASFIDTDDTKWNFFTLYQKEEICGEKVYHFIGYSTCYLFYAYPDKIRPRISQVLVLPVYQRQGHCSEIIKAIYKEYVSQKNVLDMTAEDPSENFQRVRDFIDAVNCLKLPEFQSQFMHTRNNRDKYRAALEHYKINRRQARRICEILRLYNTDENSEKELSKYYTLIRTRIASPFTSDRFRSYNTLLKKERDPEELEDYINKETKDTIDQYRRVVHRLHNHF